MVMASNMNFFPFEKLFCLYIGPTNFNKLIIPIKAPIKYCLETTL